MALMKAVLKKALSHESLRQYSSPPPEIDEEAILVKKKRRPHKYAHIQARVDSSAPWLDPAAMYRALPARQHRLSRMYYENMRLVALIKKAHFMRGRVDSRWKRPPQTDLQFYENRVQFLRRTRRENLYLYKRIVNTCARVATTKSLHQDWRRNKRDILARAQCKFVLFPPEPVEDMEDRGFAPTPGIRRPRVHLTLRVQDGAVLGDLTVELFTDVTPRTCQLFLELVDGDEAGHGYVGTRFFRKVPNLYWTGGDVIYDNGFGCYAQAGRCAPIGAENFHFSHCMPGLLSMRVTPDDEMCGVFNVTFKPLPQLDLTSVVFGRIVRPSSTYDTIRGLGSALHTRPVVVISGSRRRREPGTSNNWLRGQPNTRILNTTSVIRKSLLH